MFLSCVGHYFISVLSSTQHLELASVYLTLLQQW